MALSETAVPKHLGDAITFSTDCIRSLQDFSLSTFFYLGTTDGCHRIENLHHWVPVAHQVSK
jgi:hypothetical protein